jgi:hypothetical protein
MHTGVLNALVIGTHNDEATAQKSFITLKKASEVVEMLMQQTSSEGDWVIDAYNETGRPIIVISIFFYEIQGGKKCEVATTIVAADHAACALYVQPRAYLGGGGGKKYATLMPSINEMTNSCILTKIKGARSERTDFICLHNVQNGETKLLLNTIKLCFAF